MRKSTLQVQRPFGQTMILAVTILLMFIVAGEHLARTDSFQSCFARPTWGSRHTQFEIQLDRLNHITKREGPVDCILFGNSMVMRGFDPIVFSKVFHQQTGQDIRCFNFGVDGLPTVAAAKVAKILKQDYRPRLLIYGTDARDYAVKPEAEDAIFLLETPWIKYRQGKFSLAGWLFDTSSLMRYRRPLATLMRFDFGRSLRKWNEKAVSSHFGFDADTRVSKIVALRPDPNSEVKQVQYYYKLLADYKMLPENLLALEEIAELADHSVSVLILEMPVPATYFYFFDNKAEDYGHFLNRLENVANSSDALFWPTNSEISIPNNGWVDYSHLNNVGASVFSEWLGQRIGRAVQEGAIVLPNR